MNTNAPRAGLRARPGCEQRLARVFALLALGSFLACHLPATADAGPAEIPICFDYGCARSAPARFDAQWMLPVARRLAGARNAVEERVLIAEAVAAFYVEAGRQTPVWRDRGGNQQDDTALPGAMDCLDHTANTTAFLRLLERGGMLRFHDVGVPLQRLRLMLAEHWSARLVERATADEFAIESWYVDPGVPAVVMPVARWRQWAEPFASGAATP